MRRLNLVPVWLGGLVVALLGWQVGFQTPAPGLDSSWNAGLAMAVEDGLHFGREIAFTYGPLGFLQSRAVFFGGQAALSVLYTGALYVLFCIGLVWALRRAVPPALAVVTAFFAVAVLPLPLLAVSLLTAVIACFWLLEAERPSRAVDLFVLAAATFAAPAALIKLSTGPLVAIALVGARAGGRRIAAFVLLFAVELSGGYSSAMLRSTGVTPWNVTAGVAIAVFSGLALIAAACFSGARDRRGRWAGVAIAALVSLRSSRRGSPASTPAT